jgi:non-specific protein-tyrosine kinase
MTKLKKAMERAKKARAVEFPRGSQAALRNAPVGLAKTHKTTRQEVNPAYSTTRIIDIDPDTLRRNKVVSLFHQEEMTDQIKILRAQVLRRMEEVGGNSLLVTSPNPGEGKTLTAINLAVSISHELDLTVLLVDANLRAPSIDRYFGLNVPEGLTDYLLYQEEVSNLLLNPGIEKFVILPAGTSVQNSPELLGSPRMESLVEEMKTRYPDRFIIFDSSPLLTSADPLVFSRFIDAVLLVVAAEKTPRQDISRSLELLKDKTVIGTVFNKA